MIRFASVRATPFVLNPVRVPPDVGFLRGHDMALATAFTDRDAETLSTLFSEDATYDDLDGGHHEGRAAIKAAFEAELADLESKGQTLTMEALGTTSSRIGDDTYRVQENWRMTYYDKNGNRLMERFRVSDGVIKAGRDSSGATHPQYLSFTVSRPKPPPHLPGH